MQSRKLLQVFHNDSVWNNGIDPHIQHIAQTQYRNGWYYNCQSRTLTSVLQSTFGGYYGGNSHPYRCLLAMCNLLNDNKLLKVYPKYRLITSEDSTNLENNLLTLLDMPNPDPLAFNLYLYHIPKGKSYLRKVLDENPNLNRLKQIETFCIENVQHFVRIYRNYNSTGNNSITIFSDQYTPDFINTLFVMLPHLMEIVSREATEEYELTEQDLAYNTKVEKLNNFFSKLYQIMQEGATNMYTYNDRQLATITEELRTLSEEYTNLFDFDSAQLDSFTKHLAKARNDNAQKYFTEQLNNTTHRINELEEALKQKYIEQAKYNRELAAHKLINEDDVKPFIDTIRNTKAIEVLSTTDSEMVVRVTAPLQYFQESDFETYENNSTSTYMQRYYNNPTFRKVLHKVFVTREYKLLVQAIVTLQIQDSYNNQPLYICAQRSGNSSAYRFTQFPNPHLYHHDCWGPAKSEMQKNMCAGNFELVVMQMIAAVQSVNIAENASFVNGLLGDIQNNNALKDLLTFIVETPEGTQKLNYDQIIKYERDLEIQTIVQQAETIITQTPKGTYTQVELPDNDDNWDATNHPNFENNEEDEDNEED